MMATPITHRRTEAKYEVPLDRVAAIAETLPLVATPIELVRGQVVTMVTSIYLDRPDLSLSRAVLDGSTAYECIRAREFYTHEESLVPSVWVEWRVRREGWSDRRRFALPKEAFADLCTGTLREDVVRLAQPAGGEIAGVEALRRVLGCARGILVPRFAVTSARREFAIHAPRIRVGLEARIRFHAVPRTPYLGPGALSAGRLREAFHELPHAVLCVRAGGELPTGLKELVRGLARTTTSKLEMGARYLPSS